ncbi:hypothetical protein ACFUIZ_10225 [Streptomyces cinereoruber]|uniref:hypothetical protein n=1 Tax=Streptomyces cinereoruber TaxID=67260 RepID=UPI0036441DC1
MTCDVCGHAMRGGPVAELWVCPWCYAWTEPAHGGHELARARYEPPDRRWERAETPEPPGGTAHAYGHLGTTLCGAGYDRLTASPYPWVPGWSSACPDCEEAAAVIDRRRPAEARDEKRNRPLSHPGSNGLPFQDAPDPAPT